MTTLNQELQNLIDREAAKSNTHAILLAVKSGDCRIDFRGCAGVDSRGRFYIASITKLFTATLILQLRDKGMLHLDQTAQSILVDHDLSALHTLKGRSYGREITVRQLMHQTSGLADYFEGHLAKSLKQGNDQSYDLQEVLRITESLPPQGHPDSGKSYYSDTNYQLLGAIIESVTRQSFNDVLTNQICEPLGLEETFVFDHKEGGPIPCPIFHKSRQLDLRQSLSSMGADGGIVSTLDDVVVFIRAYMSNSLFDPSNSTEARQFNALQFPIQYGFGLMRFKLPAWLNLFRETPELLGHSGASGSFAYYAPTQDIYLAGTFNQTDAPRRPFGFMMKVLQLIK